MSYTQALLLTRLDGEARAELLEKENVSEMSTRELQAEISRLNAEAAQRQVTIDQLMARADTLNAEEAKAECCALLERIGLLEEKDNICSNLPYGKQKKLEIARALASRPKLLLLDEPAAGLNPQETQELSEFIRSLPSDELSVLLIEHDMSMVMNISDYIYVVNQGELLAEGLPENVKNNQDVIDAYIGRGGVRKNA